MRFRLIEAEKTQHPVSLLCSVLGVTRAAPVVHPTIPSLDRARPVC